MSQVQTLIGVANTMEKDAKEKHEAALSKAAEDFEAAMIRVEHTRSNAQEICGHEYVDTTYWKMNCAICAKEDV